MSKNIFSVLNYFSKFISMDLYHVNYKVWPYIILQLRNKIDVVISWFLKIMVMEWLSTEPKVLRGDSVLLTALTPAFLREWIPNISSRQWLLFILFQFAHDYAKCCYCVTYYLILETPWIYSAGLFGYFMKCGLFVCLFFSSRWSQYFCLEKLLR